MIGRSHIRSSRPPWRMYPLRHRGGEDAGRIGVFPEKFNAQVWKFIVANVFKDEFAERRIQEVSGTAGGQIQTEAKTPDLSRLSREEREALRRRLLIALGDQ